MSDMDLEKSLATEPEALTLLEYQRLARLTDRSASERGKDLAFPSLGLFGEVGSLLSEVKKKQRNGDSRMSYETSVLEELGDILWYFSVLADRAAIQLPAIAGATAETTFASLQPALQASGPKPPQAFEGKLLQLAGLVGAITATANDAKQDRSAQLTEVFGVLLAVAEDAGVRLSDAAHANLKKIFDRWPLEEKFPPLFDEAELPEERLP